MTEKHANTVEALANRGLTEGSEATKDVISKEISTASGVYKDDNGLTERQEGFAQCVAKGLTLTEAYEQNYDCSNSKKATTWNAASKLIDHPAVAARVKHLLEVKREKTHAIDAMRIRQHVFDRLMIESVEDESPPAARIKALELLGKIDVVSMFKEQKGPNLPEESDPVALEAKLRTMLKAILGVVPPIPKG